MALARSSTGSLEHWLTRALAHSGTGSLLHWALWLLSARAVFRLRRLALGAPERVGLRLLADAGRLWPNTWGGTFSLDLPPNALLSPILGAVFLPRRDSASKALCERNEVPAMYPEPSVLWSNTVEAHLSTPEEQRLRALSLWWDGLPGPFPHRAALAGDIDVDVAVVGAGYTGLWTAYYLLRAAPRTRVALLDREVAGFGASGRNGGWCSALFSASSARIAREHGAAAARAMRRAMNETVDEVGKSTALAGIDCGFAKGGTVVAARNDAQVERAKAEVSKSLALGFDDKDLQWLTASEAEEVLSVPG
ncbi:MAG TPA: FAD-dependent oxidoreductase, partial [Acidimicrobiales bacterium]|nr:FAD-dependent oxidoreductase [Acidimicrobiales bacterium]